MDPQPAGRLDAEWEQFVDHGGRLWWWCEMDPTTGCDVCFFESDPEWEKFVDHLGRPWWWRQRGELCFYEPADGAAGTLAGRPDSLEKAQVGAIVAVETYNGDVGGSTAQEPSESRCCVPAAAASPGAQVWLRLDSRRLRRCASSPRTIQQRRRRKYPMRTTRSSSSARMHKALRQRHCLH